MPRCYASGVIPSSVEEVWRRVRPFGAIHEWHPGIESGELVDGNEGAVGAVRRLTLGDGAVVVERLTALDDVAHTFTYEFVENPLGARRYVSTLRLAPVTDTGQTFLEWWAEFDAEAADEGKLTKLFAEGVYGTGIAALQK